MSSIKKRNPTIKITIAGRGGVGKTTLCKKAVDEIGVDDFGSYTMTIGVQFFILPKTTKNGPVNLLLWDLAGQVQFAPVIEGFFGGTRGIVLAYDSTSMESYQSMHETWIPLIKKKCDSDTPIILVSTKNDLIAQQEVDPLLVREFLENDPENDLNFIEFLEVSAKDDINVNNVFDILFNKIVEDGISK
jgi:small GTP-binding protein